MTKVEIVALAERWQAKADRAMAIIICEDCGKKFDGGPHAYFCPECRKRRLRESAKRRNLSEIGHAARAKKKAKRAEKGSQA